MDMLFQMIYAFAGLSLATLLELTLKTSVVLSFAGFATFLLRNSSAAIRHWVWSLAFISILVLPSMSLFLPEKPIRVLPPALDKAGATALMSSIDGFEQTQNDNFLVPVQTANAHKTMQEKTSENVVPVVQPLRWLSHFTWHAGLILVWFIGAAILLLRLAINLATMFVISFLAKNITATEWQAALDNCLIRLDLNKSVRLKASRVIPFPMTLGIWRPVILVPALSQNWTGEQCNMILLHETAHIKRVDFLTNLIAQLVCALFWYNPLVWLAKHYLQFECERACDDYVIRQGTISKSYATFLLDLARSFPKWLNLGHSAVQMVRRKELKHRLQCILNQHILRHSMSRISILFSAMIAVAFMLPLAAIHLEGKNTSRNTAENALQAPVLDLKKTDRSSNKIKRDNAGAPETVDKLIFLLRDHNPKIRAEAAKSLGRRKMEKAIDHLIRALKDNHAGVRENAMLALAEFGKRWTFYAVIEMLRDPSPRVRAATLQTLQKIGCDPAFVSITASLTDVHPAVRETAAKILGELAYKPFEKPLHRVLYDYSRKTAAVVLKAIGPIDNLTAMAYLAEASADHEPVVRLAVAQALGKVDSPRAKEILRAMQRDGNATVRAVAARSLKMNHT